MNRSLFEISQSMYNLLEYHVDDTTGEVIETEEDFIQLYESIQMDLHTKIDNTNSLGKILDGEIDVIDKEIKRLQAEKKSRETKKQWLENRVDSFIKSQFTDEEGNLDTERLHKFKLDLPHSKISYRKSKAVEANIDELANEYTNVKIEKTADKKKIKADIEKGIEVKGAKLVDKYNIQIK